MIRCLALLIAACAVAVSCLALLPSGPALGAAGPSRGTPGSAAIASSFLHPAGLGHRRGRAEPPHLPASPSANSPAGSPAGPLAACEQRLEASQRRAGTHAPTMAIVGASFTAGVGPGRPGRSWAVLLARQLRWNAVVDGDPGAGYVRAGAGGRGPIAAELARVGLRTLAPALVIVQAGHDDIGVPLAVERQRVTAVIDTIRAEVPGARIALLTVFPGRRRPAAGDQTDRAIVTAARAADPQVIIMDPLTGHWVYGRSPDGLHPTAAGDAWIAREVAGILQAHGVHPAAVRAGTAGSIVCDSGISAPRPASRPAPSAR